MSKIIYLASPYSNYDKSIRELRYLQITEYAAQQIAKGHLVFSPITYGHVLSEFVDLPTDFEFWETFCIGFLSKCEEMHVIKLDKWDLSEGIKQEILYCVANNIKIKYINYEG
jgi:hypothetical protein